MIGTLSLTAGQVISMNHRVSRPENGATSEAEASLVLVLRARAGDEAALNDLMARYLPRLQRWAHGRLPTSARGALDTHDLVQDTLTNVVQRIHAFEPRHEGAFQGFVRTVLLNRIRDIARQAKRRGPADPLGSEIVSNDCSPLDEAIGNETLARYDAALERLSPEDRELIIARVEMCLPYSEIVPMFGKPSVAAAHMAVSRALVKLAEEMAHERKR
jgi:RNA polymerase sigma-70 factor (ECF subfamily)